MLRKLIKLSEVKQQRGGGHIISISELLERIQSLKKNRFGRDVSTIFIGRVALLLIGMVSSVYISRALGPEGKGVNALMASIASTFSQFFNMGLHSANTYYVSKNKSDLPYAQGSVLLACGILAAGALVALPVFLINPGILKLDGFLTVLTLIMAVAAMFIMLQENIFLAIGKAQKYVLIQLIMTVLHLALPLLLSMWLAIDVTIVALCSIASSLVAIAYAVTDKSLAKPVVSADYFRKVLPYSVKSYIGSLASYLLLRADIYMLNYYLTKAEVAYYSLAVSFCDLLFIVTSSVSSILYPRLAGCQNISEKEALWKKTFFAVALVSALCAGMIALLAKPAIPLFYGVQYKPSIILVRLLITGSVFWGLTGISSCFLTSENKFFFHTLLTSIAFFINIGMNVYLIPRLGTSGAAIASVVSYAVILIGEYPYVLFYIRKKEQSCASG